MKESGELVAFPKRRETTETVDEKSTETGRESFMEDAARLVADAAFEESGVMYGTLHTQAYSTLADENLALMWTNLRSAIQDIQNTYGFSGEEMLVVEERAKHIFQEKAGPMLEAGGVWHARKEKDDLSQRQEAA